MILAVIGTNPQNHWIPGARSAQTNDTTATAARAIMERIFFMVEMDLELRISIRRRITTMLQSVSFTLTDAGAEAGDSVLQCRMG